MHCIIADFCYNEMVERFFGNRSINFAKEVKHEETHIFASVHGAGAVRVLRERRSHGERMHGSRDHGVR